MSTNIQEKDITHVMKMLTKLPTKKMPNGWKFSKTKRNVSKYQKSLYFHGDTDLAHSTREHDATEASQNVQGTLLQGTMKAPVEFVTNVLLSPKFRENTDPRIQRAIRLHRDTDKYSAVEYYHWVNYGSGILPSDDNHSIVRTVLVKVDESIIREDDMGNYKEVLMEYLNDEDDQQKLQEAIQEKSLEQFTPIFLKVFGNSYVILQTSLVSEESERVYGSIAVNRFKSTKTKPSEVYPNSGFIIRSMGSSRCEVFSILFSDPHASASFGQGIYNSCDPLISMTDTIEAEYEKIMDKDWKKDMLQFKYFRGETDEVGAGQEPAPMKEPTVTENKVEEMKDLGTGETALPEEKAAEQV